jgi:uncharacterized protein involved in exopolysaccharide biosynthesis/Mrp family chromosome partitioning ATPase
MLVRNPESYSSLDDDVGQHRNEQFDGRSDPPASFWRILRWRAKWIAACGLTGLLIAGAVLVVLPARYKATTIVLVDPRQPRVTNNEVITGIGTDAAAVESQVELIESSALAMKVISRLKLAEDPDFTAPSLVETITNLRQLVGLAGEDTPEARANRLVYRFQAGLSVRRRGLTYVLEISYAAKDPAKAALISRTVADVYLDDQRTAKMEITSRASGWLGERLEAMRDRVREADRAVADYRAANGIVDVTQGNKLISRQVEDLTQQLALTRSKTADARARVERAEQVARSAADPTALAEALQSPVIANLRSQYTEAARLQAEYSALYGERHPSLIAVRSQLAGVRRQIDQELARIIAGVRNDYRVAEDRERMLQRELNALKEQSATATQADVRLHELEREAQATRALFEQFLLRARETTEQQSLQIADARIVSPALTPLRQDRPPAPVLLAAAAIGGLVLGLGLVLLAEQMRRGVRSGAEIESLWSLACMSSLPIDAANAEPRSSWWQSWWRSPFPRTRRPAYLAMLDASSSPYAANLHALRDRLQRPVLSPQSDSLVVLSALPEEGKSTFACNYARVAARNGSKTLLIDGDFYNASATKAFNIAGPGLYEVLQGRLSIWNALQQAPESALCVVGARDVSAPQPGHPNVSEAELGRLLSDCRKHFDLIVIDCPAVLSAVSSIMPFVACADRAVLLVRWNKTDRQAVTEALATLGEHTRKIVGAVLNMVPADWYQLFDNGRYRNYYAETSLVPEAQPVIVPAALAPAPIKAASRDPAAPRQAASTGFRL